MKEIKTEVYALGQHISMSVHKARRVIDQIRGRSYEETLMILELMPYRACYPILKLVYSAAANASYILRSTEANLFISKAEVNEGTTMKRLKLRARGHSYQIKRPTCHITIVMKDISLNEYEEEFFFHTDKFRKNADKFLAIDSMEWLKKTNRKNQYRAIEDHDRYSNGGPWDKK
uniref:Large ribosomal subunit protein uL22c n=1 Tax=Colensoa physaloides TaxID=268274 RepID=A0A291F2B8_9ASTR|nr:ribosomal protein L22 [Colensoa physaloides]ATG26241.1 ribosomal protein L22 [Colensoa physaloides]